MTVAPTPLQRHAPDRFRAVVVVLLVLVLAGVALLLLRQFDVFEGSAVPAGAQGSGVAATQTRQVSAFGSIELAGSNNVNVLVGRERSVVVHADDNLLRVVTTRVVDGRLVIANTPGSFRAKSPMWVEVHMPSLDGLRLTGSGVVSADGIDAGSLKLTLDGSGVIRASGRASRLDVSLGGSGDAQLEQLLAEDVHAVVAGSGRILVNATKTLDASVPGSGVVMYRGEPAHVSTNISGSGAVIRG